ncbi:hypothetical protein TYRP_014354 [Tyrophagus putrescentiae]|nr:hypothetical protein TYRP_014354 [Tyrophagus putrescentiae]
MTQTRALSGWCDASITYPIEYVKVMLQLQEKGKEKKFANATDVVRQTIRYHGLLGMYRGFSVVFTWSVPKYTNVPIKTLFIDSNGHLSPLNKMLCGLGAGVVEALFAVVPQDSVKIKFINDRCSEQPKYRGLLHGIREIVRERGLGAMYTGVTPTVLKQSSNQAIRFFVFESLKDWWSGSGIAADGSACNQVPRALIPLFGMLAGCASVICNSPLDTIKTRMQGLQGHRYRGTVDCIRQMYSREGVLSFYKGVSLLKLRTR